MQSSRTLHHTRHLLLLCVPLLAFSAPACGGVVGTRPHDMSYEEHQAAAGSAEGQSETHEALADQAVAPGPSDIGDFGVHQMIADRNRVHAHAHREAAETLANEEFAACLEVPAEARDVCPLAGAYPVLGAEAIPQGARLLVSADAQQVRASVECHRAHAAYLGFEGMDACPFYLQDVVIEVRPVGDGETEILLRSEDEETVERIRATTVDSWQPET